MVSVFGYGAETASFAAFECSFKKLKITFKPEILPFKIEEFFEQHITSLRRAFLIYSSKRVSSNMATNEEDIENFTNKYDENI